MPPSNYTPDTSLWPRMESLRGCLEEQLIKRNLMPKCEVRIMPGLIPDFAVADSAWVRLVTSFFTSSFPQQQALPGQASTEAAVFELTVVRCIRVPGNALLKPSEEIEYTRLQLADKAAMVAAARCCGFPEMVLGSYVPFGPEGGIYGGVMDVTVGAMRAGE